ncbi:MAG: HAMP domain-containing sensor histidine kinase [Chloroflexota bacterium]
MDLNRPATRLLGILLIAAIPPLVAFAIVTVAAEDWLASTGKGTALLIGTAFAIVWVGLVTLIGSRQLTQETQLMIDLVRRGVSGDRGMANKPGDETLNEAQSRLAAMLDERNLQIAQLAAQAHDTPITEDAPTAARSMVAAARSLTGDPTWTLVVLRVEPDELLAAGVYTADSADGGPAATEEVHRWASTLEPADGGRAGARHAVGPWGAFVIVDVAAGDQLRAILLAPWEGRLPPSPAELDLIALLGQHASTTIEHALLYTRLRLQTDELNRVAAVQTDFLRGVTHDLQTPLTSIGAVAAELKETAGLDQAARMDLDTIAHQADRLRRMVSQLLTVSRLEAGALTPRQEIFRAEPIVRRTWEALRADRTLELVTEGPAHLMVGDPDRVEQALWAMLDNAVKYSPPASTVRITVASRPLGTSPDELVAEISITDEGAGMDANTRDHAFEQFYRSADARRLAPDGSGVGLYAARGLVRAMGGDILLETRLGVGTTVTVTLPAEAAEEAQADARSNERSGMRTV